MACACRERSGRRLHHALQSWHSTPTPTRACMQAVLERCLPRLTQLLAASSADLVKAIVDLLATLDKARVSGAGLALRRVWQLAFAREEGIRNAVASAFYDMNIAPSKGPGGAGLSCGATRLHACMHAAPCWWHPAQAQAQAMRGSPGCVTRQHLAVGCAAVLHPWRCAPRPAPRCLHAGSPDVKLVSGRLVDLAHGATLADLAALEELLGALSRPKGQAMVRTPITSAVSMAGRGGHLVRTYTQHAKAN